MRISESGIGVDVADVRYMVGSVPAQHTDVDLKAAATKLAIDYVADNRDIIQSSLITDFYRHPPKFTIAARKDIIAALDHPESPEAWNENNRLSLYLDHSLRVENWARGDIEASETKRLSFSFDHVPGLITFYQGRAHAAEDLVDETISGVKNRYRLMDIEKLKEQTGFIVAEEGVEFNLRSVTEEQLQNNPEFAELYGQDSHWAGAHFLAMYMKRQKKYEDYIKKLDVVSLESDVAA